ncbi:CdaR family transcriptional regulator [Kineosporia sp. A_224]|uniref:PucR family transcriptional regulator n=1 Tax=Kineosporia sp. A_224 TaxID=1962180 RepID=UPI000B4B21C4|nr:helix-turn-helix domain-containing protein [Kineosporia sp. A_224]
MGHGDVQRVVDRLAAELARSVVVDDPAVRPLCTSPHYGDEDEVRVRAVLQRDPGPDAVGHVLAQGVTTWTRSGVIPARPDIGMHRRVCVPVRYRGELLGLLLVMDADASLTEPEVLAVEAAAREVAAWMVGERRADDAASIAGESLVAGLVADEAHERRAALTGLRAAGTVPVEGPVVATVLAVSPAGAPFDPEHARIAVRHALADARRGLRGPALTAVRDLRGTLLQSGPGTVDAARAAALARQMVAAVVRVGEGRIACVAGLGEPVDRLEDAWVSHRQAVVAARAASRPGGRPRGVDPGATVVAWRALGAYGMLLQLPDTALDEAAVPAAVRALVAADPRGRLVETLRSFLAHGGSAPATAAALHIHRTSLYYRLDRIRDLAGVDLDDGETRLELHLGLKLLDLVGG